VAGKTKARRELRFRGDNEGRKTVRTKKKRANLTVVKGGGRGLGAGQEGGTTSRKMGKSKSHGAEVAREGATGFVRLSEKAEKGTLHWSKKFRRKNRSREERRRHPLNSWSGNYLGRKARRRNGRTCTDQKFFVAI